MNPLTTATIPVLLPYEVVWQLAQGVVPSHALHVIAELGVADALDDGTTSTAEDLALACGADGAALDRVLRLLCSHGIFAADGGGFRHNAASELLRDDHPRSMRMFARLNGLPCVWSSISAMEHAVRTGRPGVETFSPDGFFGYLATHRDEAAIFERAMEQKARADIRDLLEAYDVTPFRTIADIGGGLGHLLDAALGAAPQAHGVLFDLPAVIDRVAATNPRLRTQPGDFFVDPLPVADLYLIMEIIHDWSDRDATKILSAVRAAARPGATVLIVEHIPPDDGIDAVSQTLDVLMLTVTGGLERTPAELGAMLRASGFEPSRTVRTTGPISAVEAVAI